MLTPSYDFNLFGLDQFSPLMANEFGAGTSFSAADPASYVDYSLNQLSGLLQPFNPLPYVQQQFPSLITPQSPFSFFSPQVPISPAIPGRPGTVTGTGNTTVNVIPQQPTIPDQITVYPSGTIPPELGPGSMGPPQGTAGQNAAACLKCKLLGFDCTGVCPPGDTGAITAQDPNKPKTLGDKIKKFFADLPSGAPMLILAVVVIILLLLFVNKDEKK